MNCDKITTKLKGLKVQWSGQETPNIVISFLRFGGCRLLLIIFDPESASRIVWSLVIIILIVSIPESSRRLY